MKTFVFGKHEHTETECVSCLLLEGVFSIAPAQDVEDAVVDSHWDGEAHDSQGDCGDHSDDAKLEQGQQTDYQPC